MLRMRAVMFKAYGPPEVLTQVDLPTPIPRGDQVLIRVHATTVTSADCGMRRGEPRFAIVAESRLTQVERRACCSSRVR